jgi:hypothetical protein
VICAGVRGEPWRDGLCPLVSVLRSPGRTVPKRGGELQGHLLHLLAQGGQGLAGETVRGAEAQVSNTLARCRPKLVALVHAKTSTGAWQPLEEMAAVVHQAGALLLVDAVTSLAGALLRKPVSSPQAAGAARTGVGPHEFHWQSACPAPLVSALSTRRSS